MIRPLLLLLLFGTGFSTFAQNAVRVLTLEDAVSLAQANNRLVKNAQLSVSMSDDQVAEARTYRFPSLNLYALGSQLLTPVDFTFQRGAFGSFPGIGPVPATDTRIHTPLRPTFYGLTQFSQPLSQQYKIGLNIKQAKLAKLVDEQQLRAQKQSVTSQVKQVYYAILRTQSSLASSEENLKFDRELDRTTEQYVAEKTALKSDSMDVKAKIAQEEYNNLTLRDSLTSQKEQLNDFLGRDIRTDFSVAEVPEATIIEASLDSAQAQALSARPELAEARLTVQQAELNRRIGGENAKQVEGFRNLAVVMGISIAAIFLALVLQFNHAVKLLLVFGAVPYGIVGALLALFITGTPFGFMAFWGIASLIGVIVSHVIVLFDFIEEMREKGEPLERALVDAGIVRLRPVLITVGATVLALFPLALHGGPLWKPLCYSQIGGLGVATFITLLLVPVFYAIFVLDLKLITWDVTAKERQ